MVHEFIDETYRQTNLTNESEEYLAKREELRLAEIELMQHREKIAALRRGLPQGAVLQGYEFLEGPADLDEGDEPIHSVRLSELFSAAKPPTGDLPLDVRQEKCQAVPDVHDVDRWSKRRGAAHRPEHRFCDCRGCGSKSVARSRTPTGLEQFTLAQRRFEYV